MKWVCAALLCLVLASSPAKAGSADSELWFLSLSKEARFSLQADLILLGQYGSLVDGEFGPGTMSALVKFQRSIGEPASGVLSDEELSRLHDLAQMAYNDLGMEYVEDHRADSALPVPRKLLGLSENAPYGTRYLNSDSSIVLETSLLGGDLRFDELYAALSASRSGRNVLYSSFGPDRLVVSGDEGDYHFYTLYQPNADGLRRGFRGYTVTWVNDGDRLAGTLAVYLASSFLPLSEYRSIVSPAEQAPPVPEQKSPGSEPILPTTVSPEGIDAFGGMFVARKEPSAILLVGEIGTATPLEFRRALKAYPAATTLMLSSPGGLVDPALMLAHEVRDLGMRTVVPVDAECLSACSFVYLAGKERRLLGSLGVHQVWNEANDLVSGQAKLSDVLEALSEFGVDQQVISIMLRTPPEGMHIFTPEEAARLRLETAPSAEITTSNLPFTVEESDKLEPLDLVGELATKLQSALDDYQQALDYASEGDFLSSETYRRNSVARLTALCTGAGYLDIRSCIGADLPAIPKLAR